MVDVAISFLWPDGGMAETLLDEDVEPGTHLSRLMNMTETKNGHIVYFAVTDSQIKGLYQSLGIQSGLLIQDLLHAKRAILTITMKYWGP